MSVNKILFYYSLAKSDSAVFLIVQVQTLKKSGLSLIKYGCVSGRYVYCLADESNVMVLQSTTGEGPSSDSGVESTGDGSRTGTPTSFANNYTGILTLVNQQRVR
jgi:hypothetical protein